MAACGARVRRPGAVFVAPALYRADFSYVARNNRRRMRYKFVSAHVQPVGVLVQPPVDGSDCGIGIDGLEEIFTSFVCLLCKTLG